MTVVVVAVVVAVVVDGGYSYAWHVPGGQPIDIHVLINRRRACLKNEENKGDSSIGK